MRDGIGQIGWLLRPHICKRSQSSRVVLRDADEVVLWYSIYGSLPIAHVPSVSGTPTPAFAPLEPARTLTQTAQDHVTSPESRGRLRLYVT
jgi:hypothetical protein